MYETHSTPKLKIYEYVLCCVYSVLYLYVRYIVEEFKIKLGTISK